MPDEDQLFLRPADPPRAEQPPTDIGLEFLMAQIATLPTRQELAWLALVILFVGAVLGIVGLEAFWRYVSACGTL
jgi:hypothetical protein